MFSRRVWLVCLLLLHLAVLPLGRVLAAGEESSAKPSEPSFESKAPEPTEMQTQSIGATVIHPVRSANVGTEIGGVIEAIHFEEGEKIREGQVVVEMTTKRYLVTLEEAEARLKTLELTLQRAEEELRVKKAVYDREAASLQEVLKAEAEVEVTRAKINEARKTLELAKLNAGACTIKAPFTGYLAIRYKQPYETVDRFEKVFALVDNSEVYAVANVSEELLPRFAKDAPATFVHSSGKRFNGKVDKLGTLIDPKSGTSKVYVLIPNPNEELKIGTTGRLEVSK